MIIKPIRRLDNENLLPCDFNLIRSVAFIFRPTNVNLSLKDIACLKLCLAFINSIFSCQENSRESLMHPILWHQSLTSTDLFEKPVTFN